MTRHQNVLRALGMLGASLAVLLGAVLTPVFAATNSATGGPGNGLKVSPVRSDLTVNPGQTVTEDVYIQNITNAPAIFQVLVNDFTSSSDESGSPAIILNPNQSAPSHGLKQYIAPIANVSLQPNEQKDVKVVITIPKNAPGGGYFGAIRFAPADAASNGKNVSLSASVASLILVRVPGDVKEQTTIASFDAREKDRPRSIFTHSKDIDAVVRFQNEGNVQEQPFGSIVVKNLQGKIVGRYNVNATQPRGNVLPDSIRKFTIHLNNISSFGKYTVVGNFGYGIDGSNGPALTATTTFYVVPIPLLVGIIILIVVILVAIFEIPRMIRRYNQRILRRAGRR